MDNDVKFIIASNLQNGSVSPFFITKFRKYENTKEYPIANDAYKSTNQKSITGNREDGISIFAKLYESKY